MDPQHGPPQPDLLIGQTIGNYLVTQKLGEGGMGAVYLAEHPSIGKKVALKVLHSEFSTNQDVTQRFFNEARAVNDIGHPNIVDIVDFGIIQAGQGREQLVYFIMEYLAGATLSQLIRGEAPLPPERALQFALQVADALSASHKCGIVHRDLKPDNIILLSRGRERDFVKLLDFGIAKLTSGSAAGSHQTKTGLVMGTPAYMSPEQCEGRNDKVDQRTDVYALGIVLYEMLTGRVPFQGDGYGEILVQHMTRPPVPPSQYRMLQAHVEVVVLKALEKRADMRYPTMDEFMRAMSDPVGYVEANGGVGGFLQRQLMPSNAPLPAVSSVRLTPAPLTPLPGTILAPSMPGVAPGMPSSHGFVATPAPTTLGSAAGQVQGSRGKVGYILAGLVIVAVAVALIIVLVGKDKVQAAGGGSEVASGSAGSTTGSGTAARGSATPGSGSEAIAAPGPGSLAAGAGSSTAGSGSATATAGSNAESTGSGSAAAQAGSDTGPTVTPTVTPTIPPTIPDDRMAEIGVSSTPPGARIYVNGSDTGKTTPDKLKLSAKARSSIAITLKLKGYEPFTLKSVDVKDGELPEAELVKIRSGNPPPAVRCRTADRPGCARDSKGCCVPESGTSRTGSGNRAGSGTQDPDDLMRP